MSNENLRELPILHDSRDTILPYQPSEKGSSEAQSRTATPPIALALPQLLDAEKKQKEQEQTECLVQEPQLSPQQEITQARDARNLGRPSASSGWPGRLHPRNFSDTPTTQESRSNASAAENDEHHFKSRPSVVRSTIKGLLTATRRRASSSKGTSQTDKNLEEPLVKESEIKQSVANLGAIDAQHLPQLQASPEQIINISGIDGTCFSCFTDTKSLTQVPCALGTDGQAMSRKSTLTKKFVQPAEPGPSKNPAQSMISSKSGPNTPVRGRCRSAHSPGGRRYSLDQRSALSPSRSNSPGSRSSLTFNIRARVSPGRGLGKNDDTELFVTANVGSDEGESDEDR